MTFWRRDKGRKKQMETAANDGATSQTVASSNAPHPYADDALKNLSGDQLHRGRLASRLARILSNVSEQSESAVVGLVGPWGSGKTSLLDAVEQRLRDNGGWHIANYNPWSYSSLPDAVIGFFSELSAALPEDTLQKERRAVLGAWAAKAAPLGAAGGLVGMDASGAIQAVAQLVSGDQSPEKLRNRAAAQLSSLERPVLVVLDDLDRLEPNELLLTFKLIRLLGRLPNVFYLLAYDEETLEAVLGSTALVGAGKNRARSYLEKMIQIRLDIPHLLDHDRATMLDSGLNQLLLRHSLDLDEDANSRLQQAWSTCLCSYMSQPRAIKKLLAQVDALWPEVAAEVDFVDFLLCTFLRTFERAAFDIMVANRSELVRASTFSALGTAKENHADTWARWVGELGAAGVSRPQDVLTLMASHAGGGSARLTSSIDTPSWEYPLKTSQTRNSGGQ